MLRDDAFRDLAHYYDPIMEHVHYDRWFMITTALAELLPASFRHLDAGCGTGVLVNMLRRAGWTSFGMDLSHAMVRTARRQRGALPIAVGDLRTFPFHGVDYITCLFDSINFLLKEEEVRQTIHCFANALQPGGLLYFDIVTERMVTDFFEDQTWTEDNGRFRTTWSSVYNRNSAIAETTVRVNTGGDALIRERIYPTSFFIKAIRQSGFTLLAAVDATSWRCPTRRTTRIDFVAMKDPARSLTRRFQDVKAQIQQI
ncbi:MAG TPA: class I SAM-dependent methyltransferase [Candidatus Hydrogenedentes bacterium]|nr:class I SAM-dependent methyltransferase [Candidatus Hydrogenedentota bacterium]